MMILGILIQAFTVGLSGAVMPGPLLTYTIQLSYKKGFWVGPQIVLGHAILEAALILAVIGGLGNILTLSVTKIVLWLIGGLLLAWMGYELVWKESRKPFHPVEESAATTESGIAAQVTNLPPVLAGIIVSISNPYWALWWTTIGLSFITKAFTFGWLGVVTFYFGHILSDLGWYSLVSGAISKGKRYITAQIYRGLLIVCGIFLLFIALGFIGDALRTLGVWRWIKLFWIH